MLSEMIEALQQIYDNLGDIPVVVDTDKEDLISVESVELGCLDIEKYVVIINPYKEEE